jgi:L-ascorbate metabolism protein UlaG (beta-lactamase superfamily)
MKSCGAILVAILLVGLPAGSADFPQDTITTSEGDLVITFIGHGTLMFEFAGQVIHADPWSRFADYGSLPKADLIVVTHDHGDHLDPAAIAGVRKDDTVIVVTQRCADKFGEGTVMANGDTKIVKGIKIEAVPAYNLVHMRSPGQPFHPKGAGNGYVLTLGDARVYIAGDTENVPEMKQLQNIDIAFLPMNLPYTMTPEMVADAARAFRPAVLYPYHYGQTDVSQLADLLAGEEDIELRIRPME